MRRLRHRWCTQVGSGGLIFKENIVALPPIRLVLCPIASLYHPHRFLNQIVCSFLILPQLGRFCDPHAWMYNYVAVSKDSVVLDKLSNSPFHLGGQKPSHRRIYIIIIWFLKNSKNTNRMMCLHFICWTWIEVLLDKLREAHETAKFVALEFEIDKGVKLDVLVPGNYSN